MTYRIAKSVADTYHQGFAVAVQAQSAELKTWRDHMARVQEDRDNAVGEEEAHVPYPRPIAPSDVEAALDGTYEPDFEIYDDGPTDEQKLEEKKRALTSQVLVEQDRLAEAIVPHRKRRLMVARLTDIHAQDAARGRARQERIGRKALTVDELTDAYEKSRPGRLKRIAKAGAKALLGVPDDDSPEKIALLKASSEMNDLVRDAGLPPEAGRPKDDDDFLRDAMEKEARVREINRWAAENLHDIEDLTLETVDAWSVKPFIEKEA